MTGRVGVGGTGRVGLGTGRVGTGWVGTGRVGVGMGRGLGRVLWGAAAPAASRTISTARSANRCILQN